MADDHESIGKRLKQAREAGGLCIDDVVFRTKLPRTVLLALEAEDFSVFSSPLYAKSFLAQYSGYLEVDAIPWLDALEPGAFGFGGAVAPIIAAAPAGPPVEKTVRHDTRGGWIPVLGLFALSTGLVAAAVKGYEFFESKFAVETLRVVAPPATALPVKAEKSAPAIAQEDENLGQSPPRAIIVR